MFLILFVCYKTYKMHRNSDLSLRQLYDPVARLKFNVLNKILSFFAQDIIILWHYEQ